MLKIVIFLLFFLVDNSISSVTYDDKDYIVHHDEKFDLIFPENYQSFISEIIQKYRNVINFYEKEYDWKLDHRPNLIFSSDRNQVANGYVTLTPRLTNFNYSGGFSFLESSAESSWVDSLILHEGAHLFQLNVKNGFNEYTGKYTLNKNFRLFPYFIIFSHPNQFLPTFVTEGNATLNESRFGKGGRLYSGEYKALFHSLIKDNVMDDTRIMNSTLDFPYGTEKYIVGGYFFLYLSRVYGVEKTNFFFKNQANHYLYPLILSSTFEDTFGKSFYTLFNEFLMYSQKNLKDFKQGPNNYVVKSQKYYPMTKKDNEIYFMTSDYKSYSKLNTFNISTKKNRSKLTKLKFGRVFNINGDFYSLRAQTLLDQWWNKYSLFNEYSEDLKQFRGKYLLDVYDNKNLYVNLNNLFKNVELYIDNELITDKLDSNALFDEDGNYYYFERQKDTKKIYKNKKQIGEFKGHYAKLVDVIDNQGVYFLASTKLGSSLYQLKNNSIYKKSNLDTLVDAKILNENQALVTEVTSKGYEYKVISLISKKQKPYYKKIFIDKEEKSYTDSVSSKKASLVKLNLSKYSLLKDFKFDGVDANYTYSSEVGSSLLTNLSFTDPLKYNSINTSIELDEQSEYNDFYLSYMNQRYPLNWSIYYKLKDKKRDNELLHLAQADFSFSNNIKGYWYFKIYQLLSSNKKIYNSVSFFKKYQFPLSFYDFRKYKYTLEYFNDSDNYNTFSFSHEAIHQFDYEIYFKNESITKFSNKGYNNLNTRVDGKSLVNSPALRITFADNNYNVSGKLSFEISKVFNYSLYFSSFPLSLRRFSGILANNNFIYKSANTLKSYSNYGYGLDFELLFIHKSPLKLKYLNFIDSNNENEVVIKLEQSLDFH